MTAPTYLDFEVTQEDIDAANAHDEAWRNRNLPFHDDRATTYYSRSSNCPVANALRRLTGYEANVQMLFISIKVDPDSERYTQYVTTEKLTRYLKKADEHKNKNSYDFGNHTNNVKPEKFRIRIRNFS